MKKERKIQKLLVTKGFVNWIEKQRVTFIKNYISYHKYPKMEEKDWNN